MSVPAIHYMDNAADPAATLGWPASLPIELALGQQPVKDICQAYGITKPEYERLRADRHFQKAVLDAAELLQQEGMAFRLKARAQAEALLQTSWSLIHKPLDEVSAPVKASLIQMTIRCAGLDASIEQKARASALAQTNVMNALTINLHLGD
jgi:hypothetical protein